MSDYVRRLARLAGLRNPLEQEGEGSVDGATGEPPIGEGVETAQIGDGRGNRGGGPDVRMARPSGLDDASWGKTVDNAATALFAGHQYMREKALREADPETIVDFEDPAPQSAPAPSVQSVDPASVQSVDPRTLQSIPAPAARGVPDAISWSGGNATVREAKSPPVAPVAGGRSDIDPVTAKPRGGARIPQVQVSEIDANATSEMTKRLVAQEGKPLYPASAPQSGPESMAKAPEGSGDGGMQDALDQSDKLKWMARMGGLIDRLGTRFSRNNGVAPNTALYKDLEGDAQRPIQMWQDQRNQADKSREQKLKELTTMLAARKQGETERHNAANEDVALKQAQAALENARATGDYRKASLAQRELDRFAADRRHRESVDAANGRNSAREAGMNRRLGVQEDRQRHAEDAAFLKATGDDQKTLMSIRDLEKSMAGMKGDETADKHLRWNQAAQVAGLFGEMPKNAIGMANDYANPSEPAKAFQRDFQMLGMQYQHQVSGATTTDQERASINRVAQGTGSPEDIKVGLACFKRHAQNNIEVARNGLGYTKPLITDEPYFDTED